MKIAPILHTERLILRSFTRENVAVEYIPKYPERYFFEDTIQYCILKCEFIEK